MTKLQRRGRTHFSEHGTFLFTNSASRIPRIFVTVLDVVVLLVELALFILEQLDILHILLGEAQHLSDPLRDCQQRRVLVALEYAKA